MIASRACRKGHSLYGPRKNSTFCHSERSEESLLLPFLVLTIEERFFALLRMTNKNLFRRVPRDRELCDGRALWSWAICKRSWKVFARLRWWLRRLWLQVLA